MAATNPFRVSDLIAKYGWKVMPYLSNLGSMLLAEAQVLFVDSGHTNALDADDTEHGHSFEKPLDTIDYAIGLCTAGERSVIIVAPGHNEPLGDAQIDFDVSDITVIGIGEGSNKPTIDFDHANASVDIGANNVHLINLRFLPSITDVLIGVDIEASVTGTILERCDFAEGEDLDLDEFVVNVALKAGCTNTKITNCLFRTVIDAAGCTAAVKLTGVSDNVIIEKSRFVGNWSTAAVHNDSGACTDLLIDDCTMKVLDGEPGIEVVSTTTGIIRNVAIESTGLAVDSMIVAADMSWFNNYGVTGDGTAAEIIGGGEVQAALQTYNLDHLMGVAVVDEQAMTEILTGSALAHIITKGATGAATDFDPTTDSLEAIRDYVGGTTSLDGINLDHLALTAAGGTNYPTTVTAQSILGMIMGTTGDPATFVKGTDSLQAIADHVQTLMTTAVGSAAYPSGITNESVVAYLMSKSATPAASSFDNETDSLEAISDKIAEMTNPNSAFAEVYWVDADSGSDANNGLSPGNAFATIAAAITANNTAFGSDSDPQRTMYIHSKTYTENLTTWPENCTMIGIGGKVRIQGYHTISHTQNLRIHNIQFRSNQASVPILDVTGNCHGLTLDKCVFDSQAAISECVKFTGSQSDIVINNCRMGYETNAAYSPAIGIRFAGVHAQRGEVTGNRIFVKPVTGIGIQIDSTMTSGNFLLIKDNVIMGSPASDDQCAIGINDLTASPRGGVYVHNWISAIDGMFFTVAGNKSAWLSMDNIVNENGSSLREDSLV